MVTLEVRLRPLVETGGLLMVEVDEVEELAVEC